MRTILLFCITFLLPASGFGQLKKYAFFDAGVVSIRITDVMDVSGVDGRPLFVKIDSTVVVALFHAGGGLDYPLRKFSDDLALGVNANLSVGYLRSLKFYGLDGSIYAHLPVYITLRKGLRATEETQATTGWGLGVGYAYTLTAFPHHTPVFMADVSFREEHSIRFSTNILPFRYFAYHTSEGKVPALRLRTFSLGYLKSF